MQKSIRQQTSRIRRTFVFARGCTIVKIQFDPMATMLYFVQYLYVFDSFFRKMYTEGGACRHKTPFWTARRIQYKTPPRFRIVAHFHGLYRWVMVCQGTFVALVLQRWQRWFFLFVIANVLFFFFLLFLFLFLFQFLLRVCVSLATLTWLQGTAATGSGMAPIRVVVTIWTQWVTSWWVPNHVQTQFKITSNPVTQPTTELTYIATTGQRIHLFRGLVVQTWWWSTNVF